MLWNVIRNVIFLKVILLTFCTLNFDQIVDKNILFIMISKGSMYPKEERKKVKQRESEIEIERETERRWRQREGGKGEGKEEPPVLLCHKI